MPFRRALLRSFAAAALVASVSGSPMAGPVGMNDGPSSAMPEASGVESAGASLPGESGAGLLAGPLRGTSSAGVTRSGATDGIDFGEAGRMVRLLEEAERNRAGRVSPLRPDARATRLPLDATLPEGGERSDRGPATGGRAALPSDAETIDAGSTDAERPRLQRQGANGADDAEATRVLAEMASPEQRNFVVDTVRFVRSAVSHPLTWVMLGLLGAITLMLSAAGRRKR